MPYLIPSDLKTHIYQELVDEIVRNDAAIATEAIQAAIELAKSYLSKYDLVKLFGDETTTPVTSPEIISPMLKKHVKDIACWYLLTLSNANISLELFEKIYDDAIKWLRDIQKGMSNPEWPYRDINTAPIPPNGDSIAYTSNPKRRNHW